MNEGTMIDNEAQVIDNTSDHVLELAKRQHVWDEMSKQEAETAISQIRQQCGQIMQLAWILYQRKGFKALGYNSIKDCFESELSDISYSEATRLLKAASVESFIYPDENVGRFSPSIFRPFFKSMKNYSIKDGEYNLIRNAWDSAMQVAKEDGMEKPTANMVQNCYEAVKGSDTTVANNKESGKTRTPKSSRKKNSVSSLSKDDANASRKADNLNEISAKSQSDEVSAVTKNNTKKKSSLTPTKDRRQKVDPTQEQLGATSVLAANDSKKENDQGISSHSAANEKPANSQEAHGNVTSKSTNKKDGVSPSPKKSNPYLKCGTEEQKIAFIERSILKRVTNTIDTFGINILITKLHDYLSGEKSTT